MLSLAAAFLVALPAPKSVAAPCDAPVTNEIACENTKPGNPESEWDISGAGSASIQGFATDISVNQGATVGFKVKTDAAALPPRHLPDGLLRRRRAPARSPRSTRRRPRPDPADLPDQTPPPASSTAATGPRRASWAVPATAVSGIYFAQPGATDTGGASHIIFVVRDDASTSDCSSRPPTPPGRPTTATAATASTSGSPAGRAYKVSYNRPVQHPRRRRRPGLRLQRRVPDGPLPRGQRLRRQLHHRRRHRPPRRPDQEPQDVPVRRPRRVLVRAAARQRRGGPRRRRATWRSSAATRSSGRPAGRTASTAPAPRTAPWSPTRRPTPTPRSIRDADLDRHLARPALQPAGRRRPAGERPDRHDLHGQLLHAPTCRSDGATARCGSGATPRVANLAAGRRTTTLGHGILGYEWDEDPDNGSRPAGLIRLSDDQR